MLEFWPWTSISLQLVFSRLMISTFEVVLMVCSILLQLTFKTPSGVGEAPLVAA